MNNNKKSQVRNILGFVSIYTFIFLCLAFVLDRIFDSEGKTFICDFPEIHKTVHN